MTSAYCSHCGQPAVSGHLCVSTPTAFEAEALNTPCRACGLTGAHLCGGKPLEQMSRLEQAGHAGKHLTTEALKDLSRRVRVTTEAARALHFEPHRKLPVVVGAVRMPWPFEVQTPEGVMRGEPGDYLLRGIKGELYPCKNDIFEQTYELARDDT